MIRASIITIAIIALALSLGLNSDVFACTCMANIPPPCQEYWRVDAVFVGRVTAKEIKGESAKTSKGEEIKRPDAEVRVTFTITEAFRGVKGKEVDIFTSNSGNLCGYSFEQGGVYIVYAREYPKGGGKLSTDICTRTQRYSESSPDIAYVRSLANAAPGAVIFGAVTQVREGFRPDSRAPLANIRVVVTGKDKRVETRTDAEGRYKILSLPAGEYTVRVEMPKGMSAQERKVTVVDRGCAEVSFQHRL